MEGAVAVAPAALHDAGVPISKTQRWLDLIAFLAKRRFPVTVEDLMESIPAYAAKWRTGKEKDRATVRRMFERDKDELRGAGIPLETRPFRAGGLETQGYVLAEKDFYMPYLRIVGGQQSPGGGGGGGGGSGASGGSGGSAPGGAVEITPAEARLAMDALRRVAELPDSPFAAEARSALAKLRFDLETPVRDAAGDAAGDADARGLAAHEAAPVLYAGAREADRMGDLLRLLTECLRARVRVKFSYHGIRRRQATSRDVAPYGLLHQQGHWYLVGHDATRDAVRVFRLGRMEDVVAGSGPGPEYEHDPGFDLSTYAGRGPWELGDDEPVAARVRFDFPLSLWAERNDVGEEVEREAGGAVVRRFQVRQADPLLRWLQSFGGDAVVTDPPELRRAQTELGRATAALYAVAAEADG